MFSMHLVVLSDVFESVIFSPEAFEHKDGFSGNDRWGFCVIDHTDFFVFGAFCIPVWDIVTAVSVISDILGHCFGNAGNLQGYGFVRG